jgi:hypothetical protein
MGAGVIQTEGGNIDMTAGGNIDGDGTNDLNNFNNINANVKNFDILHPTKKEPWRLRYSVLEGPEIGVFLRGRLDGTNEIILPYYWQDLVHEDSVSVILTPIGSPCVYYVKEYSSSKITIGGDFENIKLFYTVFAERKDVDKLIVEYIQSRGKE